MGNFLSALVVKEVRRGPKFHYTRGLNPHALVEQCTSEGLITTNSCCNTSYGSDETIRVSRGRMLMSLLLSLILHMIY